MVCSDIAARGIDISDVGHIVMFDFPLNPIDYLHRYAASISCVIPLCRINESNGLGRRAGRTGRMEAKGRVTSLVAKRDRVLARAIEVRH